MNIIKSLMYSWQEDQVVMPPTAVEERVADCVEIVTALIEKNRRVQERLREEARRRAEEDQVRHPGRHGDSVRGKTDVPWDNAAFLERVRCYVPDFGRRPPNLKAQELSFSARLLKLVRERCGGKAPLAYKRAGIDRKLYSKIVSDDRSQVSKQTALQLVIGLQLNMQEAAEFLKAAGYSFSPTIPMDCVFEYCIEHQMWNIIDVNDILVKIGLPSLNLSL